MIKILNVDRVNPPVFIIVEGAFQKTIIISFEYKKTTYKGSLNTTLNTEYPPSDVDWFNIELIEIKNNEDIIKDDLIIMNSKLKKLLSSITNEYNEAIKKSYETRKRNQSNLIAYLNKENETYQAESDKSFEDILSDSFKKTFFDYSLESKLEIVNPDDIHVTEKILKELNYVSLQIKENKNCSLLESKFKLARKLFLGSPETDNVPIVYTSKWSIGEIKNIEKTSTFNITESGKLKKESEWGILKDVLFFSNYKTKELENTLRVKELINRIELIIENNNLSESFDFFKLNKNLFELNYREIVKIDYSKNYFLIKDLNNPRNYTIGSTEGSLYPHFNEGDIDELNTLSQIRE